MTGLLTDSFFEAVQSPSILTDSTGSILKVNYPAKLLFHLESADVRGRNIHALFKLYPEGEESEFLPFPLPAVFEALIYTDDTRGDICAVTSEVLKYEGRNYYWFSFRRKESFSVLGDQIAINGKSLSKETSARIDEKEKYRDEVGVIKERYRLAVEASQTGVGDYNFENDTFIIDESLHELLGYQANPNNSRDFWIGIIHPEDRQKLVDLLDDHLRQLRTYFEITFRIRHQSKIYLWVLCRGKILVNHDKPSRIIFAITDISERIESTEQLNKALVNFKSVFDAFPDLFFRLNKLGDYLEVAGNKNDLIWPDYADFKGKNIKEALPPDVYRDFYKILVRAFESFEIESCEYSLNINNSLKYFEARIKAISEDEAIVIVRNISDAVRINSELVEAKKIAEQALNAKDEFLSTISHEIRTPLNVVVGMAYLLLQNNPRLDQLKYINTLKFSSSGLITIINDLLDLSKIRSGRLELEEISFNLSELINNITESYKAQFDAKSAEFSFEISDNIPLYVIGDPNRLTQILNNLLNNAFKFTEKGYVRLKVKVNKDLNTEKVIEFCVEDSGIGIDQAKIGRIFEPYVQSDANTSRKYGGTGLGLAIIKQLVEMQQGSITVESELGRGSVFRVQLRMKVPKNDDVTDQYEKTRGHDILKERNIRLLYADDVASNRFLMQGYFDLWGCVLETATDGQDALNKATAGNFDLILLDLQMPVMDGYKTARAVRKLDNGNRDVPIIAITGDISGKVRQAIHEAGFNDILVKPINPIHLYELIIQSILGEKSRHHHEVSKPVNPEKTSSVKIGFESVDLIYNDVPDQYQQLLEMLLKEYESYRTEMTEALKARNYDGFRQIRHTMTSNMKLFQMGHLRLITDSIRKTIEESPDQDIPEMTISQLVTCFDEVIDAFSGKLKALISH
jgi:PAS domain S-box-containing protein